MSEDKELQESVREEELLETTDRHPSSEENIVDSEEKTTNTANGSDEKLIEKSDNPEEKIAEEKMEETEVSVSSEEETADAQAAATETSKEIEASESQTSDEEKESVLEEIKVEDAEEKLVEAQVKEIKIPPSSEEKTEDSKAVTTATSKEVVASESKISKGEKENVLEEIEENNTEENIVEEQVEKTKVSPSSQEKTEDSKAATTAKSKEIEASEIQTSEEEKEKKDVLKGIEEKNTADTQEKIVEETKISPSSEEETENSQAVTTATSKEVETSKSKTSKEEEEKEDVLEEIDENNAEDTQEKIVKETKIPASSEEETEDSKAVTTATSKEVETYKSKTSKEEEEKEDVLEEIDENNAEDAEDTDNHHRHNIPILDYHSMSTENLVGELQRLVRNEKVQAIKKHVDGIKSEFDLKFQEFIEHKKEDFVSSGGNEIDFRYNSVTKRQFNEVYSDYREKRNQYYKSLEKDLKGNLNKRLEIIERLKGLVNVDEDMNTTYKAFKNLQEEWRKAGPVPRTNYNDVWRTYQHHIEIFYDFLHLNRELRDLDFKHNLAEKEKLVQQAEVLATELDLSKVFRELQTLHKIWKEDIGPVGQEHREAIWERFSNATKVLHQRRQEHYKQLDAEYEENLIKKNEIIASITTLANNIADNHRGLQQQIKELEELRNTFFNAGKVPRNQNEKTWAAFKNEVRNFNRNKNAYYKNLKKDQQENLDKKRELLNLAISLKESDDWDTTTGEMKRIQSEWKKIGHVPRRYSDKIWKEFKNACNHYFDRLHESKNKGLKEEEENFEKKNACLDKLKAWQSSENREADIKTIKTFIEEWKSYGRVPFKKKNIDQKFHKVLDALFKKLDVSRQESELLKYGNKIKQLADGDNERAIQNERSFIRKKIEESKSEIRQLENNLQFFSNASEDNPLVQDVIKRVNTHKESLETWMAKLKKLNIMKNSLNKPIEEETENDLSASSEDE